MKKTFFILSGLAMSLSFHGATQAQTPNPEQAYQDAMQICIKLTDAEAQINCKRDAGAALQQAKRTPPKNLNETTLQKNRLARCQAITSPARQEECIAQMTGQIPSTVFGSVEGGGILRESVITIQGEPTSTPPQAPTYTSPAHTSPIR